MRSIAWGAKVSPEFVSRLIRLCASFGWSNEHASWLMACMAFESAETFSPSIKNMAGSGATGLIQFMPSTAKGLGTTVEKLAAMSAVEQLDYVEKYFKPYAKRISSLPDMYMAILLPTAVGKPDDYPLFTSGAAYRQNAALDADSDGVITKREAAAKVQAAYDKGMRHENTSEAQTQGDKPMPALAGTILLNALPTLIAKLPEVAKIFSNPNVAERNVEAISKVGEILVQSTGATNVQEAVERVEADPKTAAEANNALRSSRAELLDIVERMAKLEDDRVTSAREFNNGEPMMVDTKWFKMKFVHILSMMFVVLGGGAATYVLATSTDVGERTMALQTLLLIGFGGVASFWLGSSRSSQLKDEYKEK